MDEIVQSVYLEVLQIAIRLAAVRSSKRKARRARSCPVLLCNVSTTVPELYSFCSIVCQRKQLLECMCVRKYRSRVAVLH